MIPPRPSFTLVGLARYEARWPWVGYMSRSKVNRCVTAGVQAASCVFLRLVCVRRDFAWFAWFPSTQRFYWKMAPVYRVISAVWLEDGWRQLPRIVLDLPILAGFPEKNEAFFSRGYLLHIPCFGVSEYGGVFFTGDAILSFPLGSFIGIPYWNVDEID